MQYEQAVTEARTLAKRSEADQWRLAELTYEQVRLGGVTQVRWAEDIGTSHVHVGTLIKIWEKWNQVSDLPKFADAYAEAKGLPVDRFERRQNEAEKRVKAAPPEQRAELARDLLQDPDVAHLVVSEQDPETTASLVREAVQQVPEAANAASRALSEQVQPRPRSEPGSGTGPRTTLDLLLQFQKLHHVVKETVDAVIAGEVSFNDRDRERLFEELTWLRSSLDLIESGIRSGSWDDVIHRMLEVH